MPKNLKNRVADNWRPLIAIADVRTRVPVAEPRRDTASKIVGLRARSISGSGAYRCLTLQVPAKGSDVTALLQGLAAFYCAPRRR
jgi:hypothetical protein